MVLEENWLEAGCIRESSDITALRGFFSHSLAESSRLKLGLELDVIPAIIYHRYLCDARLSSVTEVTSEFQRLVIDKEVGLYVNLQLMPPWQGNDVKMRVSSHERVSQGCH